MLHSLLSAIGLLSGAGNRANMPFTSCSLDAVFLINNLRGFWMWLRRHALNVPSHTPFRDVSVPSGFFEVRDISTVLNFCQCVSASPSKRASTKSKRPSAAST
eukprot:1124149-Ditylum_brightwellii.AAC.1